MDYRHQLLAVMAGQTAPALPFAPRMDLWYIAQRARGTLPPAYVGLDMAGLADALGVACHAVRADYTRPRPVADLTLRGLGLDNHPDYPYRTELEGLPVVCRAADGTVATSVTTPAGEVRFRLRQTAAMTRDGISLPFVQEYPIAAAADIPRVAQVFAHLRVVPTHQGYGAFAARVGARGVAVASGPIAASPMHLILHELMPMDRFFYLYADQPELLRGLARAMEPYFEAVLEALAESRAEVVFWGGNYDRDLTWPAFFQAEIAPWLRRAAARLHRAGKLLLTHTDGENEGLLPLYPDCGFDVAESVCPAPMTRCTLAQIRAGMGPAVTVWGGIPSVALLPDSMSGVRFDAYLDATFANLGSGRRLLLGVSDNVPPDCDLGRLQEIARRARDFRPGAD